MGDKVQFFQDFRWLLDLLDIVLVTFIIYRIFLLIKGTRAVQMLLGLAVILIVYVASQIGELYTLHWILDSLHWILTIPYYSLPALDSYYTSTSW